MISRTISRTSIRTVASVDTFLSNKSEPTVTLRALLDVINRHPSLQRARIVRADSYQKFTGRVTHRFIILELQREGRQTIWLRIDRERASDRSVLNFVANKGTSLANDRVS